MNSTYCIRTYGCQMNVHDSEKIDGVLREAGYARVETPEEADIVVFNTCCVRETAERRILGNIGRLKSIKRARPELIAVAMGCMTQRPGGAERIMRRNGIVDIALGTEDIHKLPGLLAEAIGGRRRRVCEIDPNDRKPLREGDPVIRSSYPNAWIDIMYGCDNFCAYCIVPYVRGRERSRDPDRIATEAKRAIDEGYREITLLGQNVDSYSCDGTDFAEILRRVAELDGDFRVRFMSSHPKDFGDRVIETIRASDKICKSIHLPAQSGSDRVLRLMNRKYTRERYLEIVRKIRESIPDAGITSDIMVGFPTETDEDFRDTLSLMREARFSNAFTFVYSPRPGAKASEMPDLSPEIKKARIVETVALQNEISAEIGREHVGRVERLLVESAGGGFARGRTDDGRMATIKGGPEDVGRFVEARIVAARASALEGEATDGRE